MNKPCENRSTPQPQRLTSQGPNQFYHDPAKTLREHAKQAFHGHRDSEYRGRSEHVATPTTLLTDRSSTDHPSADQS
jgi:hypothetical protein